MGIEDQIRKIAREEHETQLAEIEKQIQRILEEETVEIKKHTDELRNQLENLASRIEKLEELNIRIEKLEEDLSNRWGLLVRLRKYTLDQLMTEYKRLTGSLRPDQEESVENAEI